MQLRVLPLSISAAALLLGGAAAQCSTLTAAQGVDLALTDEAQRTLGLPFAFRFDGVDYDHVTVSSNGMIWLGNGGLSDFTPSANEALALAPRIMPLWWDLDPGAGGAVTFCAQATQVAVAWRAVPQYAQPLAQADFECILAADGTITFVYGAACSVPLDDTVVGITRGGRGGVPAPANPVHWATALGGTVATQATATEATASGALVLFTPGSALAFRLAPTDGAHSAFTATAFAPPPCAPAAPVPPTFAIPGVAFGAGCPAAAPGGAIYEDFRPGGGTTFDLSGAAIRFVRTGDAYATQPGAGLATGYTAGTVLPMADDTVHAELSLGAMQCFPFGADRFGSVSVCSNGFLWLGAPPPANAADFSPTVQELLGGEPRLAPLWLDLDFAGASGGTGTMYWENAAAGFCRATWAGVGIHGVIGTALTFQVTLFANGDFEFAYGPLGGAVPAVVGVSGGSVTVDPGRTDLVVGAAVGAVARAVSRVQPMTLAVAPAHLGSLLEMRASLVPPIVPFGVFAVGAASFPSGVDLAVLGAPGCRAYAALDFLFFVLPSCQPMTAAARIPYDVAFLGLPLAVQAAAATAANPLGLHTSNGVACIVGL